MSKDQIVTLPTFELCCIVRSTKPTTTAFAKELDWAKTELRRRGFSQFVDAQAAA